MLRMDLKKFHLKVKKQGIGEQNILTASAFNMNIDEVGFYC